MSFAETVVPLLLDKQRNLVFNANTMKAYEKATGKFFLDTVASLYDAMRPALEAEEAAKKRENPQPEDGGASRVAVAINALDIIHKVPMNDLVALIWAALHEYGKNPSDPDEPSWPMTINRVGRLIQLQDVPRVFTAFLKGQTRNSPSAEEMGESPAQSAPTLATPGGGSASRTEADGGGERSIELPADAFA